MVQTQLQPLLSTSLKFNVREQEYIYFDVELLFWEAMDESGTPVPFYMPSFPK